MMDSENSYMARMAAVEAYTIQADVERQRLRPFMLLKPDVFADGDKWCVLYGPDIQIGVCAFGNTPEQASIQFDIEWKNAKAPGKR